MQRIGSAAYRLWDPSSHAAAAELSPTRTLHTRSMHTVLWLNHTPPLLCICDPCSKYLAKNIALDRLLTEFKQDQDDTSPCDSGSEDLADDEGLRNDAAAAPGSGADMAASPGYSHSEDGSDDIGAVKVNDTLGYQVGRCAACRAGNQSTRRSLLWQATMGSVCLGPRQC